MCCGYGFLQRAVFTPPESREDIYQISPATDPACLLETYPRTCTMAANRVERPAFDLDDIHESLVDIAYKAGEIITSALPATNDTGSKKNSQLFLLPGSRICMWPEEDGLGTAR